MRDHIAEVAGRLFYQDGIHDVGMDRVAAEAVVSKRTVYKHFPTKDVLVAAGLRAHGARFMDQRGTPREQIVNVFDQLVTWTSGPGFRGCPYINAVAELSDPRHPARVVVIEAKARRLAWFAERLQQMGVWPATTVAEQLLVVFDGAIATAAIRGPDSARAARVVVEAILDATSRETAALRLVR